MPLENSHCKTQNSLKPLTFDYKSTSMEISDTAKLLEETTHDLKSYLYTNKEAVTLSTSS